jgi:hypothetical protein
MIPQNNRIMKYLLKHYFNDDRESLAKSCHKSEESVNSWFKTNCKHVQDDTVELLLYKLNKENKPISIKLDTVPIENQGEINEKF